MVRESCSAATDSFAEDKWKKFSALLSYFEIDATDEQADWSGVKGALSSDPRPRIFYLAVAPRLYVPICEALGKAGLKNAGARVVLEKPIGSDLQSADEINKGVVRGF